MDVFTATLTRRAPAILFVLSAFIFIGGIVSAMSIADLTSQQVHGLVAGAGAQNIKGVAQSQLFIGIMSALQSAVWPFAAGALIQSLQSRGA
jgi:hypothetical protein